jgi:hypothetical protein
MITNDHATIARYLVPAAGAVLAAAIALGAQAAETGGSMVCDRQSRHLARSVPHGR